MKSYIPLIAVVVGLGAAGYFLATTPHKGRGKKDDFKPTEDDLDAATGGDPYEDIEYGFTADDIPPKPERPDE